MKDTTAVELPASKAPLFGALIIRLIEICDSDDVKLKSEAQRRCCRVERDMDPQFLVYLNPVIILLLLILGLLSHYLQRAGRPNFAGLLLAIAVLLFLALAGMNWFVRYVQ